MPDSNVIVSSSDVLKAVAPALAIGLATLGFVIWLVVSILRQHTGDAKMVEIATAVQVGARAFLVREYIYCCGFVVVVAVCLAIMNFGTAVSFVIGAFLSGLCGWIGMSTAVRSNVRTAAAARQGLNPALRIAFKAGSVMGLVVVSLGILGLSVMLLLLQASYGTTSQAVEALAGFGFGASSIALFARVGGGIFTKAADVGADLVGKVEAGIPEDDPRNPAVIADNVGDNVGDVAGMGADLFESYVGGIIASATLGLGYFDDKAYALIVPFWIAAFGILCSVVGTFLVRTKEGATQSDLLKAIRTGIFSSSGMVILITIFIAAGNPMHHNGSSVQWNILGVVVVGLVAGVAIGTATEYYTSFAYEPTQSIARASKTGAATVIIQGLGVGMISCVAPVVIMVIAIMAAFTLLDSVLGVAIAAVGMLSTLGVTLATDAYGPVADNAGGIAEMAELPDEVRDRTDALDALGNTTAATGKGFAIGSAVLTALALLAAFKETATGTGDFVVDVAEPAVMSGVLVGALLPFIFGSLTMLAVGKSAMAIIEEVRRQFHSIPGLMDGTSKPEYETCVSISTKAACKEMVIPGGLAVLAPLTTGLILGTKGLAGMLTGAISSGFLLAVTMANAGGAWDNSKKWVEAKGLGEGNGKGSECHKGAVVGDTVGDPFKDTSGPALNILIKLMSVVSLVLGQGGLFPTEPIGSGNNKWWVGLIVIILSGIALTGFAYYNKRSAATVRSYANFDDGEDTTPMRSDTDQV